MYILDVDEVRLQAIRARQSVTLILRWSGRMTLVQASTQPHCSQISSGKNPHFHFGLAGCLQYGIFLILTVVVMVQKWEEADYCGGLPSVPRGPGWRRRTTNAR